MACRNSYRWGSGTTCERPQNTAAVKEMDDRMKSMMAERARVDALWSQPAPPTSEQTPDMKFQDLRKISKSTK